MSFGIGDLNWNVYKKLILVRTGGALYKDCNSNFINFYLVQ